MQPICNYICCATVAWTLAAACWIGPASAQHVDILVGVRSGQLLTGVFELEGDLRQPEARVFGAVLPSTGSGPVFTQSPGFSALPDSGLPPGSLVGFDLLGPLEYWSGKGAVQLQRPSNSEALRVSVGPQAIELTGETGITAGFNFAQVSAQGTLHRHPTYSLLAANGNVPALGVYAAPLMLRSGDPAIAPSAAFWLVFDYGAGLAAQQAALDWIEDYRVRGLTPGDVDGDGRVDLADFGVLKQSFGGSGQRRQGDFNGDRRVDLADFGLLKQSFGAGGNAAAVPEPSAAALALLGLLALMCPGRRRRRGVSFLRGPVRFLFRT